MAFQRPALFIEIDPVGYQNEINVNFRKIDEAFVAIQNDLQVVLAKNATTYSNLAFVDKLLLPNGPVGHDSFELDFVVDTDLNWTVQLNRSTPDGVQQAVISNLLHQFDSNTRPTLDIGAIAPTGDGPHRMIIGLDTEGAPKMRAIIAANEQPFSTDTEDTDFMDLVLYEFDYLVETDGPLIRNVRRVAQPIISNPAFQRLDTQIETMTIRVSGLLQESDSDLPYHFIMPYDCEVVEGVATLDLGPQAGENIEVEVMRFGWTQFTGPNDRAEAVLLRTFIWGADTDAGPAIQDGPHDDAATQVVGPPLSGAVQLLENDRVNLRLVQTDGLASGNFTDAQARDLTVQLRIRRISHTPRRYPA